MYALQAPLQHVLNRTFLKKGDVKQRQLSSVLSRLGDLPSPRLELEQYPLTGDVAATLLFKAKMNGDLEESVIDLGCGNGILAIGASLLGAKNVTGVDIDPAALHVARENAITAGARVNWVLADASSLEGRVMTMVSNPPFGAQRKGADRPFIDAAVRLADVGYTFHNSGSIDFVESYLSGRGVITEAWEVRLPLRATFGHHRKRVEYLNVEVYRIVSTCERD